MTVPTPTPTPTTPTTAISPPPAQDSLETYTFPSARLQRTLSDPTKTPLVLVACGSFSPITHMHLRMFEMAVDHVKQNMSATHEVVGGYLSPVSDRYNKAGLASALHRYARPSAHHPPASPLD
jgi:nicotinamide mononucleotide adenylyltransferase